MSTTLISIRPTTVEKQATKIEISLFYVFNALDATINVNLKDDDGNVLKTEAVYIPPEIYASWNVDSVIVDYITAQLNLKLE
jgi:hypothetical protein